MDSHIWISIFRPEAVLVMTTLPLSWLPACAGPPSANISGAELKQSRDGLRRAEQIMMICSMSFLISAKTYICLIISMFFLTENEDVFYKCINVSNCSVAP